MKLTFVTLWLMLIPAATHAHHSMAEYADNDTLELIGIVSDIRWSNPHIRLELVVEDEDDENESVWRLEGFPRSQLERSGIPNNALVVGDVVRVAGTPSSRREHTMLVWNILLGNQTELLIGWRSESRWPQASRTVGGDVELLAVPRELTHQGGALHPPPAQCQPSPLDWPGIP